MSASRGRLVALRVIARVRERQAYAHETLDAVLAAERSLDARDAALATRLAYGTIACRGMLDEVIDRHLERPGRLEPRVRDALALSTWELLFGGVDGHVAVNEGVELVRSVRSQAATLANAVLRRIAAEADDFPWGDPSSDPAALARLFGHPLWITELLIADLGREVAAEVLLADNEPAPLYLAHLPFVADLAQTMAALDSAGAEPVPGPLAGCITIGRPAAVGRSGPGASRGAADAFLVSDAGAQFAVQALDVRPNTRVVEIGAGRGTKSVVAQANAYRAGGFADVWAVDSHEFKTRVAAEQAARLGLSGHVHTVVADGTDLTSCATLPPSGTVDAVLVDAPCSGLGTLRRHPDKRWRVRADEIETLALLGSALLAEASRLVRPGGLVVYSTCTFTRRENRDVVSGFLAGQRGAGFTLDDLAGAVPAEWHEFVSPEGWFQSVPRVGGPDGHFVARFRRAE